MKRLVFLVTLLTFVFGGMLMAQDYTSGLVGHWKFDEGSGSDAGDAAGTNDGTIYNATWSADSRPPVGYSLDFNGTNAYIDIASPHGILGAGDRTVSMWINPTSLGTEAGSFFICSRDEVLNGFAILYVDATEEIAIDHGSAGTHRVYTGYKPPLDEWTHIAFTFDQSVPEITFFVNGNYEGTFTNDSLGDIEPTHPIRIGAAQATDPDPRFFFDGLIDDVRIYDRALSETDIQTMYTDTLPVELSSFTAIVTADMTVQVQWTAETETNMLGYHVYRAESNNLSDAVRISGSIIPAANTSTEQHYTYVDEEVLAGKEYFYWLQSNDLDLTYQFHGPITVFVDEQGEPGTIPGVDLVTTLKSAYPNPFNPGTNVSFSLAEAANVTVTIYNNKGQLVRTLVDGRDYAKGDNHVEYWDGRDSRGTDVASGIYYTIMRTDDGFTMSRKMILMK